MPFSFYYGVYHNIAQIALSRHIRREGECQRKRKKGQRKSDREERKGSVILLKKREKNKARDAIRLRWQAVERFKRKELL